MSVEMPLPNLTNQKNKDDIEESIIEEEILSNS